MTITWENNRQTQLLEKVLPLIVVQDFDYELRDDVGGFDQKTARQNILNILKELQYDEGDIDHENG